MDNPAAHNPVDPTSLPAALIGDGRPLLALVALGLILSGLFAIFLTVTNSFLPHDIAFLGMQPSELCAFHQCRIVHFIFHDRTSFGGTLIAIGVLYLWLLAFPIARYDPRREGHRPLLLQAGLEAIAGRWIQRRKPAFDYPQGESEPQPRNMAWRNQQSGIQQL